jgi:hypothetical protein
MLIVGGELVRVALQRADIVGLIKNSGGRDAAGALYPLWLHKPSCNSAQSPLSQVKWTRGPGPKWHTAAPDSLVITERFESDAPHRGKLREQISNLLSPLVRDGANIRRAYGCIRRANCRG